MAATVTLLGQTFNTTTGTHTVTATPNLNDLIIIVSANTGFTTSTAPTDNNSSGTYTKITNALKNTSADLMEIYVRNSLIPSSTSTIFTQTAASSTGGGLAVYSVSGMTNFGLAAIRQNAADANKAASGTPTPTFSNAVLSGNPVITAVFNATSPGGVTARSSPSYTRDADVGYSTPTTGFDCASIASGETALAIAWGSTSASAYCDVAIEVAYTLEQQINNYEFPKVPDNGNGVISVSEKIR